MEVPLYLAYGSNMYKPQLVFRCGEVPTIGTARIDNFHLVFNVGMAGFANIIPAEGGFIEGVLYELKETQMRFLDWYEGLYSKRYRALPDGRIIYTYVGNENAIEKNHRIPSVNYLNKIIQGALDHELWDTYNRLVNYKNGNYKLKKGNKYKPIIRP